MEENNSNSKRKYDNEFKREAMRQLKRRLADAEEERDILKKALAVFSRGRK